MRHIICLLLENESGALSRVANLFSARGYNIEALSVAPTDDPTVSRMTVVTTGTDAIVEQITKQLNKLVDVIKLVDLTEAEHIERELMLIKVTVTESSAKALQDLVDAFHGNVVDVDGANYTIQMTGNSEKLNTFLQDISKFDVIEVVRSGPLGISRGDRVLHI